MDLTKRMTDRSRRVLRLAEGHACRLGHDAVEPEHLLLGLADKTAGVAANVLLILGADPVSLRCEVEARRPKVKSRCTNQPPWSRDTEKVLAWAVDELEPLGHNYVGTEHLILGLTRLSEGVCTQVLKALGIGATAIRRETYSILGHDA